MIELKIVLTGGPCAGKTTALAKIEEDLQEKGYRVFVVGEGATELIKGGIRPFGTHAIPLYDFQILNITHQLEKERLYEEAVKTLNPDTKCVIIYDRGVLDNKAYVSSKDFSKILKTLGLKELSLMDQYDMVLHLVTAAAGAEEYYTLGNNAARTETVEEARILDQKTMNAWLGHNCLKIIGNETSFSEKMNKVLDSIHNMLGNPIPIRKHRKYLVDLNSSDLSFLDTDSVQIHIEQAYLPSEDGIERRLRKRIQDEDTTYYFTVQKKGNDGSSKIVTDKKISEKEYHQFLSMYDDVRIVSKNRFSFTLNQQYFKLDVFDSLDGIALLEVEATSSNEEIELPTNLSISRDVTDDLNYQNIVLAKNSSKNHQKIYL